MMKGELLQALVCTAIGTSEWGSFGVFFPGWSFHLGFWAQAFISLDYFECLFFSVEWVVVNCRQARSMS